MKKRRSGDGSITKRRDGTYQARIMVDGVRKSFYGKTEKEALEKLRKYQHESYMGVKVCDLKLAVYFRNWMTTVKKGQLKPASYDRLEGTFRRNIEATLGNIPISRLTTVKCQLLINEAAENYSYSNVKKIFEALNACLSYAVEVGQLAKNPMSAVQMPRESSFAKETKEIVIPTDEEIRKLFDIGDMKYRNGKYMVSQTYVDAFKFICETGLRAGELLALTWDKISLRDSSMRIDSSISEVINRESKGDNHNRLKRIVTDTKTKTGMRTVYLNSKAVEILKRIKERNTEAGYISSYIICNSKGKQATYHDLQRTLARLCEKSGLNPFGLHTLRHYFASRCIASGVEMLALSKYLGHSKPSITMNVYAHLLPRQNKAFQDLLESLA